MTTRLKTFSAAMFAAFLFYLFPASSVAQPSDETETYLPHSGQSIFDLLQQQEIVEMTLVADLDSLIHVRNTNEYSKAKLHYVDEFGVNQNYKVKVRPRGKFRRRVCDVPPLKLKISKKQLEAAGLNEHNDLKLVTHCLEDEDFSEKLVLREYLAYQLYHELTPYSFRTQLVRITYQDNNDSDFKMTKYGFLIEDLDELSERMGGEECEECFGLSKEKYRASAERVTAVFQFMIGNTDWSTEMNRNVKQIEMTVGDIIPVPYDFDFSVLVNAPYLRPNSTLNQTSDMERIFQGQSTTLKEIYGTISYFKTKRARLLEIVRNFEHLAKNDREEVVLYLESFFKQLYSRDNVEVMFFAKATPLTK